MSGPDAREGDSGSGSGDLLEELRVVLPGVQVLFGFLLTLPFSQRFDEPVSPLRRYTYFGTLLCAAIATVLLIAPPSTGASATVGKGGWARASRSRARRSWR